MSDEVLFERSGSVAVVTLNRPQARNAVNQALSTALAAAMDEFDADDALTVGILTGAGGSFCAGMDLKAFLAGERPHISGRGFGGLTEAPPAKPLIAAVEGYALAGGCELMLACDLVVASREATFGVPEVRRGLIPGAGGLIRLPQRIPYQIAMELALTGDPLSAVDAHRFGLVNRLTEPGAALAGAHELAARITRNGPLAVRTAKRVLVEAPTWPADEVWARQREELKVIFGSSDAREGAAAFAERREPRWQGR
ncbi:MAG: crotonase/enoyl-CoA hydratase family protein [Pseudonocardia sp.]